MRIALILCVLLTFSAVLGSEREQIESLHEKARELAHTRFEEGYELAVEAEALSHKEGLSYEEARSIFIQAWILKSKKFEMGKSFILYLKALEVLKPDLDHSERETKLYLSLLKNTANILKDHYALKEARSYYDEAITIASASDNLIQLSQLLWNKSKLLTDSEQFMEALDEIDEAIRISLLTNDETTQLDVLNEKGLIQIELKDFDGARESFEKITSRNFVSADANRFKGMAWHNIGYSFILEEKYEQAVEAYKKAEEYKINDPEASQRFITWTDLSHSYFQAGNPDLAQEYGTKALDLYPEVQLIPENYRIFENMSSIAFERGDYAKSREYTEKYIIENDKFLEIQEEIQRTKDHYKMEVLAAGFFLEINSEKNESLYSLLLTIISSLFTIVLLAGITGQYWVRRSIRKSIQELENDSFV